MNFPKILKHLLWAAPLTAAVALMSCSTVRRTVVAPPSVPGAEFVGSDNCSQCHAEISKSFKGATHAHIISKGDNSRNLGCESCHGPGSLHAQSGGARHTIVNPRRESETCFQCHLDKRGQFNLPHHHPVPEGKMSCADCHDPHKGHATRGGGISLHSEHQTCGKCHTVQGGHFVFEHEAVREGCTTCHDPHGTVNQKMLVQRDQNLCLKCHFQRQAGTTTIIIGGRDHTGFLRRGTCWSAGCHEAVHGSQIGSSLRF